MNSEQKGELTAPIINVVTQLKKFSNSFATFTVDGGITTTGDEGGGGVRHERRNT